MLNKIKRAFRFGTVDPMKGSTVIINAEKLERRVALLEDGILEEYEVEREGDNNLVGSCLLYTSDAADDVSTV